MLLLDYIIENQFNVCGHLTPYSKNNDKSVNLRTIKNCPSWNIPPIGIELDNIYYFLGKCSDITKLGSELNNIGDNVVICDIVESNPRYREMLNVCSSFK